MAWIELHDNLPDHPKTIATAVALKMDKDMLVGKLCRFWTWAANEREDGFISEGEIETVAEVMRWTKKPRLLFDGLCTVPPRGQYGFLERVEGGYLIHGWDERIGMLRAKREERRAQTRQRVARYRQNQKDVETSSVTHGNGSGNASETRDTASTVTLGNATCNALQVRDVTANRNASNAATVPKPYQNQKNPDDGDGGAHARDPLDTTLETPEDEAFRRVLLEFLPCGFGEPTVPITREIEDMILLLDLGPTPQARADLIIRAMREVAKAPKEKRGWSTTAGLIRYWQRNGERSAGDAKHGGDPGRPKHGGHDGHGAGNGGDSSNSGFKSPDW